MLYLKDLSYVVPELCLLGFAMVALLLGMVVSERWVRRLSVAAMGVVALLSSMALWHYEVVDAGLFGGFVLHTGYTCLARVCVSVAGFIAFLLFLCSKQRYCHEFSVVMLFAILGAIALVRAGHLLSFYLALELHSLSSCVLICFNRNSRRSSEAAIKFFVLGAVSSCIVLYGISLIYGHASNLGYDVIVGVLRREYNSLGLVLGCAFVLVGMLFKLSAVPFHMWAPDAYQGSPTVAMAFFFIVTKSAVILLMAGVFMQAGAPAWDLRSVLIACVGVSSAIVGELGALRQDNMKRLLAYSNIGHLGYVLSAIISHGSSVYPIYQYVVVSWVVNAWIFSVLLRYSDSGPRFVDISGMHQSNPVIACSLVVSMISVASFPPFPSFFAKYALLESIAALDVSEVSTLCYVLFLCVASVLPCFYCFRIAKVVYFDKPAGKGRVVVSEGWGLSAVGAACVLLSVLFLLANRHLEPAFRALLRIY
ncbi:MAG: NADH-quinone oxidoreductase subunit N [Anaplasma sp.]